MIETATLICCNGQACDGSSILFDSETRLVQPTISQLLAQIAEMESKLGLSPDPQLSPQQRVDRLEAALNPAVLSASTTPSRKTRWIDSKGQIQVDLAAVFNNEAAKI